MGSRGPKQREQTPTASQSYSVSQTRQRRDTAATALSSRSLDTSFRALWLGRAWHLALCGAGCRGFYGPVPSASLDAEREYLPTSVARIYTTDGSSPARGGGGA